jgi:hypothetical protein
MSDEIQDLDEMLGFLGEDGRHRRDPEEHPSPEELSAYQANELTPEQDERIQDHFAVCRHCTELLLDLEEFLQPPVAAEPVADFEAAADWKRLREGIGPVAGKPAPLQTKASEQDYRLVRSLQMYRALAAVLGLVVVGLSLYTVRPPGEPEILPSPKSIDFETIRGSSSSVEEPVKVRLPFPLAFYSAPNYPSYRIEIVDIEGKLRYSRDTIFSEGLIPLPQGFLPPGEYEVRLSGLKDGKSKSIGSSRKLIVQP